MRIVKKIIAKKSGVYSSAWPTLSPVQRTVTTAHTVVATAAKASVARIDWLAPTARV